VDALLRFFGELLFVERLPRFCQLSLPSSDESDDGGNDCAFAADEAVIGLIAAGIAPAGADVLVLCGNQRLRTLTLDDRKRNSLTRICDLDFKTPLHRSWLHVARAWLDQFPANLTNPPSRRVRLLHGIAQLTFFQTLHDDQSQHRG
jgi:hypothetical protein